MLKERVYTLCIKSVNAFSLLEISIVLLIMGVVLSFSLPHLTSHLNAEKNKKTQGVFEEITYALSTFVTQNGRLPAPALVDAVGSRRGEENQESATGILPYKTLGLSSSSVRDGHQHWISYTPHPELMAEMVLSKNPNEGDESFCKVDLKKVVSLVDNEKEVLSEESSLQPAFVLVSHGKKGGDFMDSGVRRPIPENMACKIENTNNDLVFQDNGSAKDCDDNVFFKNRFTLLAAYAHAPCK